MERFPTINLFSYQAFESRPVSCFSISPCSSSAAFGLLFSPAGGVPGCLPLHSTLFSGDLAITLLILNGSAPVLAQSGRLDKGVWKPSAIAGAARPLFAGVPPLLVDPTPRLAPGCCAPDSLPTISPPGEFSGTAGSLDLYPQYSAVPRSDFTIFINDLIKGISLSNKVYGFYFLIFKRAAQNSLRATARTFVLGLHPVRSLLLQHPQLLSHTTISWSRKRPSRPLLCSLWLGAPLRHSCSSILSSPPGPCNSLLYG